MDRRRRVRVGWGADLCRVGQCASANRRRFCLSARRLRSFAGVPLRLGGIDTVFAEYLLRMLGVAVTNNSDTVHYVAAASILLVAFFNFVGVHIGALIQNLTASAKYVGLLLLVLASFLFDG